MTSGGGVITRTTPSPHSSPQNHQEHHPQQSTLTILAKIGGGQQIYTRGYKPADRQQTTILSNTHSFNMPRFPSAALGSASQKLNPHDASSAAGSSRSSIFSIPSSAISPQQHQHHPHHSHSQHHHQQSQTHSLPIAQTKTKAIRSSQVPQSARYTAAEVDAMVDKVQNFPGNMVPCAICSKFVKRERLRAHIHECHLLHGKRIICPHCGIGLKSKGSYRVHIWRHKRGALPSPRQRHSTDPVAHHQQHHHHPTPGQGHHQQQPPPPQLHHRGG
jgi:hypothetical protein